MTAFLQRAAAADAIAKLTPRQHQVHEVLTHAWQTSSQIAMAAKITTSSPSETAAKFAIQLTKLNLAEKGGTRSHPMWRRKQYK